MCLDRKDDTPLSTMKFGSDTLEEEQEKDDFFRVKFLHLNLKLIPTVPFNRLEFRAK